MLCAKRAWPILPFLAMITFILPLQATETTATLKGQVKDETGASLPGVSILLTNELTGLKRAVTSDETGSFVVPLLPVGKYTLQAELVGFQRFVQRGITLEVNQTAHLEIVLRVGEIEETVTVEANVSQVDTASSALGKVVDSRKIIDLPLNGRNFLQLGTLQPGVAPITPGIARSGGGAAADQGFAVHGLRTQFNNFLMDGATNTDFFFAASTLRPPPDALQEFKILTNNYSAEFGQNAGSVVNILTKSGTNSLRGNFFEFLRNDVFDARNFFFAQTPPLKQNQFGGTLGGPITIPRVYSGRDRSFFFIYYEGFRNRQGITRNTTVPSPLEREGDFSQSRTKPIDPVTKERFPGDRIPADQISPVSTRLLPFYPLPNGPDNTFSSSPSLLDNRDAFGVKVDHAFSSKHNIFARYLFQNRKAVNPFSPFGSFIPGFPTGEGSRAQNIAISDTYTISPRLLNEFRFAFNRLNFFNLVPIRRDNLADFGFTYAPTNPDKESIPTIFVSGFTAVGNTPQGPGVRITNTHQYQDNFTFIRGKHTIKAGFDIRRTRFNVLFGSGTNGQFNFTGDFSGNAFADFLLGLPSSFFQGTVATQNLFSTSYQFFGQDDFKIMPNLTLNFGLRYELNIPFQETSGKMSSFRPGMRSARFPTAPAGIVFPGDPGVPKGMIEADKNNIAPRFGFAWDPFGKGRMSIRGGYGISYDPQLGISAWHVANSAPPGSASASIPAPRSFSNPFLGTVDPFRVPGVRVPLQPIFSLDPDFATPYAQHYNLSIQRELAQDFLFEASYVGTRGVKLIRMHEINPAIFVPGASTLANRDARRIHAPNFRSINNLETTSSSNYNALELSLNKRLSRGYSFLASYTLSKAIDAVSFYNLSQGTLPGNQNQPQNPFDLRAERGLALFDTTHRLVISYVWELPFFSTAAGAVKALLGGWQLNGITVFQSGTPFSVLEPRDISLTGVGADRPDLVGDPNQVSGGRSVEQWFNTGAFRRLDPVRDAGRFGTAGRNIVRGPGFNNFDFSLVKNFRFAEERFIQFRAEFFNLFNHPNFEIPEHRLGSPNFGRLINAFDGRILQFGLKVHY